MTIKQFIVTFAILLGLIPGVLCLAAPALPVAAYNPISKACSGAGSSSTACNSQSTSNVVGKNGILARVTRLVAGVGAVIAVLVIVIYGFQMVTSYGDSGKVTAARNAVIAALIGLIVIALAQAIVIFIISNI